MCFDDTHDRRHGGCDPEPSDLELQRLLDGLAGASREELIAELRGALTEIWWLKTLLTICAGCKRIRDDQGHWQPIDIYLQTHFRLKFTHSMCPDCVQRLYPDLCEDVLRG